MKTQSEIEDYLQKAERNAIEAMAKNKWERFGYWASQVTHLRRILGISHTASPFREFADIARQKLEVVQTSDERSL